MLHRLNKSNSEDFIHAFMTWYKSQEIGKPITHKVFNSHIVLTELKNSYKVIIKDKKARFNNLLSLAEYVFKHCYNFKHTYVAPLALKQLEKEAISQRKRIEATYKHKIIIANPLGTY
jgi:hypothetical protein